MSKNQGMKSTDERTNAMAEKLVTNTPTTNVDPQPEHTYMQPSMSVPHVPILGGPGLRRRQLLRH
jgi:hypothetical protein